LDEPFAGVHPELLRQIYTYIKEIHQHGKAFIIVSHDMDTVFDLSQRVIVMNEGKKIADGEPDSVRNDDAVIDAYLGEASEKEQLEHATITGGDEHAGG
jgi:branched-chain amino acid transport system ATP-binding protein